MDSQFHDKNYNHLDDKEDSKIYIAEEEAQKKKYQSLVPEEKLIKPLLSTLDVVISSVITTPCVVSFWRGLWQLFDIYDHYFPIYETLFISVVIHVMFYLVQDTLVEFSAKKSKDAFKRLLCFLFGRLYIYVFVVSCIFQWRAGWKIFENISGASVSDSGITKADGSEYMIIITVISLVLVIVFKSVVNCLSVPFVVCLDKNGEIFAFETRFRVQMSQKTSLYILDCLFSVLVIGTLVVFVWRGAWALLDIFLFPEDEICSAWSSLVLGYSAVFLAFVLQPVMRWLCDRLNGAPRLLVADLFLIFSLIGTVNVWRGIWNLLNLYLLPDNLELSCWITHWFCLILLILMGCSNSLLVRGVYIDAEEPAGKCVVFPCYYLRVIFQEQKMKKIKEEELKEKYVQKEIDNNHVINIQVNEPQTLEINHKEVDNK